MNLQEESPRSPSPPGRLRSLFEIMNIFDLGEFAYFLKRLQYLSAVIEVSIERFGQAGRIDSGDILKEVFRSLKEASDYAQKMGYAQAGVTIDAQHEYLHSVSPTYAVFHSVLTATREALLRDARSRRFLAVASSRTELVDNLALFGPEVESAFPEARDDLRQAGNCLAAECPTAAVFHLMRAVEWALRKFARDLGFARLVDTKKSGRKKYTPLPYGTWERILDGLRGKVDKRLTTLRPGPAKQRKQEFYYEALAEIGGIKDAWRNHVMHTRRDYMIEDAEAIMAHVRRLMTKLASGRPAKKRKATRGRVAR